MKKIFTTLFAFAALTLAASATDYIDDVTVTVNGTAADPVESTINVEQSGDTYTLSIKNFSMSLMGMAMNVGNITLSDVPGTTNADGTVSLSTEQTATITAGDDSSITWLGGLLITSMPVTLTAVMNDTQLYAVIDLTYGTQVINVVFGTDFTPVKSIKADAPTVGDGAIYNILGMKVDENYKGIVIKNGKKTIQ